MAEKIRVRKAVLSERPAFSWLASVEVDGHEFNWVGDSAARAIDEALRDLRLAISDGNLRDALLWIFSAPAALGPLHVKPPAATGVDHNA